MEDLLQKVAVTGATFVGKAAWSYAASLALKKISNFVKDKEENKENKDDLKLINELQYLDKKLSRKLSVVFPIIDSCELQVAQGNTSLESILALTDEFKSALTKSSAAMYRNDTFDNVTIIKELIDQLDELIPLLHLVLQTTQTVSREKSSISYSRLIQASSALVTAEHMVSFSAKNFATVDTSENRFVTVGSVFGVRLYTLFEGSARKSTVDWTWKEDFVKSQLSIERSITARQFNLKIQEDLNDGRYHEVEESKTGRTKTIDVNDIQKMYYTCSGKMLNIQESLSPVLVLKVKAQSSDSDSSPPRVIKRSEWIALELYREFSDTESIDSLEPDLDGLEKLELVDVDAPDSNTDEPLKSNSKDIADIAVVQSTPLKKSDREFFSVAPNKEPEPLSNLCLLEYLLRLCSLEIREGCSHTVVGEETLGQYFVNTNNSSHIPFEQAPKKKITHVESPLLQRPKLMERFLTG